MIDGDHEVRTAWGFLAVRLPLPEDPEWKADQVTILQALGVLGDAAHSPLPDTARGDIEDTAQVDLVSGVDEHAQVLDLSTGGLRFIARITLIVSATVKPVAKTALLLLSRLRGGFEFFQQAFGFVGRDLAFGQHLQDFLLLFGHFDSPFQMRRSLIRSSLPRMSTCMPRR